MNVSLGNQLSKQISIVKEVLKEESEEIKINIIKRSNFFAPFLFKLYYCSVLKQLILHY